MRADRLLALLMLLQTQGRMTAQALGQELEVSERTIYRDIDALSAAGVPVYAERGPGGGVSLMDHYRTQLTGMTDYELRALFMLSIPSPLADLGLRDDLRGALLKLTAAMPERERDAARWMQQRIHVDAAGWHSTDESAPHLHTLFHAVQEDHYVDITHRQIFSTELERRIAPFGLVAKAGVWYVVFGRPRAVGVLRVSDVLCATPCTEHFTRPDGFDLAAFWEWWCARNEQNRGVYLARVRIAPELISVLRWHFSHQIDTLLEQGDPPDADGWRVIVLPFESLDAARERVLSYGRAIEVLAPVALRETVRDFARQIVAAYGGVE